MKKILWIAAIVIGFFILVAFIAPLFISSEMVKEQITAQVQSMTGRELTINGDVKIKFFPFTGAYIEDVNLSDVGGESSFLKAKSIDVAMVANDLLSGKISIKRIILSDPEINLKVDKEGKNNWDFSTKAEDTEKVTQDEDGNDIIEDKSFGHDLSPVDFSISEIKIENGNVSYANEKQVVNWTLKAINLAVGVESVKGPLRIRADARWNERAISTDIKLNSLKTLISGNATTVIGQAKSDFFNVNLDGSLANNAYQGKLFAASSSLKKLQQWLQPKSAPIGLDKPLAFNMAGELKCNPIQCELSGSQIQLDDIHAKGNVRALFSGKTPEINMDLTTNVINAERWIPTEKKQSSLSLISSAKAESARFSTAPIDFSALRNLNATATIKGDGIVLPKLVIGKNTVRAKLSAGKLGVDVTNAQLYGGTADLSFDVDSNYVPSVNVRMDINDVQAEPLLKQLSNFDRFSGKADFTLNAYGKGKSVAAIVDNLSGGGSLRVNDGAIKGINIANMLRNVQSAFKDVKRNESTKFTELSGTYTIKNGVISNDDLSMKAPLLRVAGRGTVSLPAWQVNYRVSPQVVDTLKGQGGADKTGLGIPFLVSGSLDSPSFAPDLSGALEDALKDPAKIKDTIKSVKDVVKSGEAKDVLKDVKGLFR